MMEVTVDINESYWVISETMESFKTFSKIVNVDIDVGLRNFNELLSEEGRQYRATGGMYPGIKCLKYEKSDIIPILRLPSFYHPDYFSNQGSDFVSPKLFELLDRPRGTLQGLKTDTNWFGSGQPDFSYLWLSYIPWWPAIDIDRCHPGDLRDYPAPPGVKPVTGVRWRNYMPLRRDLASPYGVFKATESRSTVLATDAVALSVLRAGCTGIEFNEVETNFIRGGPLHYRTLHGVEVSPRAEELGPDPAAAFRQVREEAERACAAAAAVSPEEKARKRAIRDALNEAALRAGMWHVEGLELADQSGLTIDDAGVVQGIDELLSALRQTHGYLFKPDTPDDGEDRTFGFQPPKSTA